MSVISQKIVKFTRKDKIWMTPVLKKMIQDRWNAYRRRNWPVYNHLKTKVKTEIIRAKLKWSKSVIERDGNIWNVVRDLQGKRSEPFVPSEAGLSSFLADLTKVFQSHFCDETRGSPISLVDDNWNLHISAFDVFQSLKKLKLKKSVGHDNLPAVILRQSAYLICDPLANIFNSSVEARIFPDVWKCGLICPIPKKRKPTINDFRPITLLPIVAKVFERIVLQRMKNDFIKCFGENQHAFRPLGSTTSALIAIHDSITSFMEAPTTTCVKVTCLDFSKAFDRIPHGKLVRTLNSMGFSHGFLLWTLSYLTDRYQKVMLSGSSGPPVQVLSGVPQGSVIGPYLFALFISTLQINNTSTKVVKYADDLTLVEPCPCDDSVQSSLTIVKNWAETNQMILNASKCNQMLVCKKGKSPPIVNDNIQLTSSINILGVTLSSDLSWSSHFQISTKSASRRLHVLRVLKPLLTKEKLVEFFRASILSLVMYASPLFCQLPRTARDDLGTLRKRAHRIICDGSCQCSILPDINLMRQEVSLNFLRKCESPSHPLHLFLPPKLPYSNKYSVPFCSTSRRQNSFFPSTCILANNHNV